jgi:hypothetical protein
LAIACNSNKAAEGKLKSSNTITGTNIDSLLL